MLINGAEAPRPSIIASGLVCGLGRFPFCKKLTTLLWKVGVEVSRFHKISEDDRGEKYFYKLDFSSDKLLSSSV